MIKIHYNKSTGKIIQVGSFGGEMIGQNEEVVEINAKIPDGPIEFYTFDGKEIKEKTPEEKDEIKNLKKPIGKSAFAQRLGRLTKEKKEILVNELLARVAINFMTESELEDLVK